MRLGPGSISALALQPLVDGLESLGVDSTPVLKQAGISRAKLEDPEHRFGALKAGRFWSAAVRATDDDVGLRLARETDAPDRLELIGRLLMTSETIGIAWERLVRFSALLTDLAEMSLTREGETVVWSHGVRAPVKLPRCVEEYAVALQTLRTRAVVGADWAPIVVRFAHPRPPDTAPHDALFGCPLVFGAALSSVVVPAELMGRPVASADPGLGQILERYSEERLRRVPEDDEVGQIRGEVEARLCDGKPHAEEVARACGMSERTMHRRLSERGLTYRTLVEDVRHALARRYLAGPDRSVVEVAFLLGFSDGRAFRRAFKSWSGVSPARFQRRSRILQ
jgi:AraC-like DNA-binding protein